ncbi:MAG TPA: hypothetical protein VI322_00260 [Candidatus Saccharimonadia bacterium]
MGDRKLYLLAGGLGSFAGAYVPSLWGAGEFSGSSILFSVIGGIAGIWLAYKLINR